VTRAALKPRGSPSPTPKPVPNADPVGAAVLAFQDAYNSQKWDDYLNGMCTTCRQQMAPLLDHVKRPEPARG
jgi:hypothetical protein